MHLVLGEEIRPDVFSYRPSEMSCICASVFPHLFSHFGIHQEGGREGNCDRRSPSTKVITVSVFYSSNHMEC